MAKAQGAQWTLPVSVQPLTWLPVIAFCLAVSYPETAVPAIAIAGVVLAAAGALGSAILARLRATGSADPRPANSVQLPQV